MNQLPPDFLHFWWRLVSNFHGNVAAARRALLLDWTRGHAIPGYGARADWSMRNLTAAQRAAVIAGQLAGLPAGWSEKNLRRVMPTRRERAILVRTEGAVAALTPWNKGAIESAFRACISSDTRAIATAGL